MPSKIQKRPIHIPAPSLGIEKTLFVPSWIELKGDNIEQGIVIDLHPQSGRKWNSETNQLQLSSEAVEILLPEFLSWDQDLGAVYNLGAKVQFLASIQALLVPMDQMDEREIPSLFKACEVPNNQWLLFLPPGAYFKEGASVEQGQVVFTHLAMGQVLSERIKFLPSGEVTVDFLSEETELGSDQLHIKFSALLALVFPPPQIFKNQFLKLSSDGGEWAIPLPRILDQQENSLVSIKGQDIPLLFNFPYFDFRENGEIWIKLPKEIFFDENLDCLVLPTLHPVQALLGKEFKVHDNTNGTCSWRLEGGQEFESDQQGQNWVRLDNYWSNLILPDLLFIEDSGELLFSLPPFITIDNTSSGENEIRFPVGCHDFFTFRVPGIFENMDFCHLGPNGHFYFFPPDFVELDSENGLLQIPHSQVEQLNLPMALTLDQAGRLKVKLPAQVNYDPVKGVIKGEIGPLQEMDFSLWSNLFFLIEKNRIEGEFTLELAEGFIFNEEKNQLELDNYWCNQLLLPRMAISEDGLFTLHLPPQTLYYDDGSCSISQEVIQHIDESKAQILLEGHDWVEALADGSLLMNLPDTLTYLDQSCQLEVTDTTQISQLISQFFQWTMIISGGEAKIELPPSVVHGDGELIFPENSVHWEEFSPLFSIYLGDDGKIHFPLEYGMDYLEGEKALAFDNFWSNALLPKAIQLLDNGRMIIDLPRETYVLNSHALIIPHISTGFLSSAYPEFVEKGPDWMIKLEDGSLALWPPMGCLIDLDARRLTMSQEIFLEGPGVGLPASLSMGENGELRWAFSSDCSYRSDKKILKVPAQTLMPQQIPEFIECGLDKHGSLLLALPDGVEYIEESHMMVFSRTFLNQVFSPDLGLYPNGSIWLKLPRETQFFDDGLVVIWSSGVKNFLRPFESFSQRLPRKKVKMAA